MKFLATGLALLSLFVVSCGQPEQQQDNQAKSGETDTVKSYLPVTDYIRGEIKSIDSLAVGILKRTTTGKRTDSAFIQPAEFRQLAEAFLSPELDKGKFEESFTETSFFDASTELLTFNYLSTNPASTVKRVDVLIAPSLQLDKIKSIYMEEAFKTSDTVINRKMYWKAGASFQVVTEKSLSPQPPSVEQVKVIWDPLEY